MKQVKLNIFNNFFVVEMSLVIFGVFDCYHPGHESFISQSRAIAKYNNYKLVAIVTRDEIVQKLKFRKSLDKEELRLRNVAGKVDIAILGDTDLGKYTIFNHEVFRDKPVKHICFGYDQANLRNSLLSRNIPYSILNSYQQERYSTTRIRELIGK